MILSFPVPRIRASVAPLVRSSLDFDGSGFAQAVAFEYDAPMPLDQRLFCLSIIALASIPYVFVGAAAALWLR